MTRLSRRAKRLIVVAVAVAVALPIALSATDAGFAVRDLRHGVGQLEQAYAVLGTAPAGWTPERVAAARGLQRGAQGEIDHASSRLRANLLTRATSVAPGLDDQTRTGLDLALSAEAAAIAFGDFIQFVERYQAARSESKPVGQRMLDVLVAAAPLMQDAERLLDTALARLQHDLDRRLFPALESQVRAAMHRLQPLRDFAATATLAGQFLPAALGLSARKTYLLLFANPAELRPAGGFVGNIGSVTLEAGTARALEVRPEESLDALYGSRFPVPSALGRRLGFPNNSLDIGDAGWDADFPTSAALSEQMYTSATGRTVDGTISIDPYAVAALLKIAGPVAVAPYGSFTAANFFDRINQIVNIDKDQSSGKKALPAISRAVVDHILSAPADLWLQMLTASQEQARGRHIQLHLHDPSLAAAARAAHFDGAVMGSSTGGDYLMVVDGNVGGTKGDLYVRKQMTEKIEVDSSGLVRHELILRFQYPAGATDAAVPKGADNAYRDYLRLYLPELSTVAGFYQVEPDGRRGGAIEDLTVEHGKRVVGTFFRLAAGQSIELHLLYQAPIDSRLGYRLYLQKQAGVQSRAADLQISYPGGVETRQLSGEFDEEVRLSW